VISSKSGPEKGGHYLPHVWGYKRYPVVNNDTYTACAICYELCPTEPKVFEIGDVSKVINPDVCTDCGACEDNCPNGSIVIIE